MIKHYRVDKRLKIFVLNKKREGMEEFNKFDMPRYTKSLFGVYGGEERQITLEAKNEMAGVPIDRFGNEILIRPVDTEHFQTKVNVAISKQFLGWIMALGNGVKIIAPEDVVERMSRRLTC